MNTGVCVVVGEAPSGSVVPMDPLLFLSGRTYKGTLLGGMEVRERFQTSECCPFTVIPELPVEQLPSKDKYIYTHVYVYMYIHVNIYIHK